MNRGAVLLASTMLLGVCATGAAGTPVAPVPSATQLSRTPVPENAAWKQQVVGTSNLLQYPIAVHVVGAEPGQVTNAEALKAADGRSVTLTASSASSPHLELDLGADTGGYVEVGVTQSTGATVHLAYSEAKSLLSFNGDSGEYPVSTQTGIPFITDVSLGTDDNPTARFDDDSTVGAFRSPTKRGAQRWIWLQLTAPGTVSIDYVRIRRTHFTPAAKDYTGHFLSSDPVLNKVWYASAYTVAVDSIPRPDGKLIAVDGAKRDRLEWIGDLVMENLTALTAFAQGDGVITRSLQTFSCQQSISGLLPSNSQIDQTCPDTPPVPTASDQTPPLVEYTAAWVIALREYVLLSGDTGFARRMLPVARRAMGFFTYESDGLYSTPQQSQNWHPFDPAGGKDAHTNATIYRGLIDLADLESNYGVAAKAMADRTAAAKLRAAMLAQLWDPTVGAFVGNLSNPLRDHTQDAQVEAVYGGVATGTQAKQALDFISTHLASTYGPKNAETDTDPFMGNYVSPFISSTELLARFHTGDTAGALALLRKLWGHMVARDPNGVVWEKVAFDGDIAPYLTQALLGVPIAADRLRGPSSYAHGWSTGPVAALNQFVLGIQPDSDGYRTWTVAPQLGDLRWAQGQSRTSATPVIARWARGENDQSFVLTAGSANGSGSVVVPTLGKTRAIARDGATVWDGHRAAAGTSAHAVPGGVSFDAVRGTHTWAWSTSRSAPATPGQQPGRGLAATGLPLLLPAVGALLLILAGSRVRRLSVF